MQQQTNRPKLRSSRCFTVYLPVLLLLCVIAVALFSGNQGLASSPPGLVSQWSAEGNANDSVGTNNGTLHGGVAFESGVVGQAFSFDGTGYVQAADTGLPMGSASRTLVFWIKPGSDSRVPVIYGGFSPDDAFYVLIAGHSACIGQWGGGDICGTTDVVSDSAWHHVAMTYDGASDVRLFVDGVPEVSATKTYYTTSRGRLYVGSTVEGSDEYYRGLVDEIGIYNRALTAAEINSFISEVGGRYRSFTTLTSSANSVNSVRVGQPVILTASVSSYAGTPDGSVEFFDGATSLGIQTLSGGTASIIVPNLTLGQHFIRAVYAETANYKGSSATLNLYASPSQTDCVAPPSGAVAWYPGDGNANDIVAGNDGIPMWWNPGDGQWYPADGHHGPTFAPGLVGQAFSFAGDSFVLASDGSVGDFGRAPFTIALWAKFDANSNFDNPAGGIALVSRDDGWIFWLQRLGEGRNALSISNLDSSGEAAPLVTFPWSPQPGQWYHVAVTRDGDTFTLYLNGLQVSSANSDVTFFAPGHRLTIGQGYATFFNGLIDEVGIYNRALSAGEIQSIFNAGSYGQCKTASFTGSGQNVVVQTTGADLTFSEVTTTGASSVVPIDPATVGQVPGGFAVSNSVAYEISTTAAFTGPVTLAFKVPGPISQADFNSLAILHNVNGTLVDVTATTPARDYSTLTIYATTDSFSPFYLARKGPHIKTLFDQTKAYKSGSTIPVKLQLLSAGNSNISSSGTALVARDLRLMSGNTTASVVDSGNSNPDYTFRYDATLGGTGGGYIFNLSTKGLAAGQYVLSFYVGSDRSFFYTVKFEVK
jgi:hypothetical protein